MPTLFPSFPMRFSRIMLFLLPFMVIGSTTLCAQTVLNPQLNTQNDKPYTTLNGSWRFRMDKNVDGETLGFGEDAPCTFCTVAIKQAANGTLSAAFGGCTYSGQFSGVIYNGVMVSAMLYSDDSQKVIYAFTGHVIDDGRVIKGVYHADNGDAGDFEWIRTEYYGQRAGIEHPQVVIVDVSGRAQKEMEYIQSVDSKEQLKTYQEMGGDARRGNTDGAKKPERDRPLPPEYAVDAKHGFEPHDYSEIGRSNVADPPKKVTPMLAARTENSTPPPSPMQIYSVRPRISAGDATAAARPANTNSALANTSIQVDEAQYRIEAGDTLYSISRRYGVSVTELKDMNGLVSNDLAVGSVLRVK